MEAALPLESVDFDHSVELSGEKMSNCMLHATHFDYRFVIHTFR